MTLHEWCEATPVCPFCNLVVEDDDHCTTCHKIGDYVDLLQKENPPTVSAAAGDASKAGVTSQLRGLVSQNKVRFQKDDFDLDLTYITDSIVAMGFPSAGTESYYRNPVDEVERFFERYHGGGHYKVYNLCSERQYDNPTRFRGQFARFPFDDHNAPCPISLIPDFCRDADMFLRQSEHNVVAIHCKAGKGRTGVMVCCLLMHQMPIELNTAEAALQFFNEIRTRDGQGVTIPSQQRYIGYWGRMLREMGGKAPELREVLLQKVIVMSAVKASGSTCDPYFMVVQDNVPSDKKHPLKKSGREGDDGYHADFSADPMLLVGDVKFLFFHRNALLSDESLFHMWFNTAMCELDILVDKNGLDKAVKDTKHQVIHKDVKVSIHMSDKSHKDRSKSQPEGVSPQSRLSTFDKARGMFSRSVK